MTDSVEKTASLELASPRSPKPQKDVPASNVQASPEKLQPMFFVVLSATLKQMRQADRADKISSFKIA